jgi:hypothetical protein
MREGHCREMAQRDSCGIGRVNWRRQHGKLQTTGNHRLNLLLIRHTGPRYCSLYLTRRVTRHGKITLTRTHEY